MADRTGRFVLALTTSNTVSGDNDDLPLVICPNCGIPVKKRVSRSRTNPGRHYYACDYYKINPNCRLWLWEDTYMVLLGRTDSSTVQNYDEGESSQPLDAVSSEVSDVKDELALMKEEVVRLNAEVTELKKGCAETDESLNGMKLLASVFLVFVVALATVKGLFF